MTTIALVLLLSLVPALLIECLIKPMWRARRQRLERAHRIEMVDRLAKGIREWR